MASKQLTAKVRLNTTQAEKSIDRLVNKINRIDNVANKIGNGSFAKIPRNIKTATVETQKWANAVSLVNSKLTGSKSLLGSIGSKLKALAGTYLGVMGMRTVINTSDAITSAENKLNYIHNGDTALTQQAMDKMYASAQKVRMGYTDMMSNVSKSMALAGDAFNNNTDAAIRFQEIMAEAYAVGGASAQEMSTSMYQLIQALGAGTLAGDELRSVREGAPLAYKEIEKFAQGVYNTEESLKDLASQGKLTSDMVVAAVLNSGEKLDNAFAQTEQTFGQTWEQIKNAAINAFRPVSAYLRKALNKAIDNGLIKKFETFFNKVAKGIIAVIKVIEKCVNWIADNWDWLRHVIVGIIIAMIGWIIAKTLISIGCALAEAAAWIAANWEIALSMFVVIAAIVITVAAVLGLIYIFLLWKTGAIETCDAIVSALKVVGIALILLGIFCTGLIVAIIGLIILAVAFAIQYLEYVAGAVCVVVAVIWNSIIQFINAIIQYIWMYFVEPFIGIVEWILNVCNGGFNSFGDAVASLIGNIISWFLTLGTVVTNIIDAIFGTNWTDGLNALQNKVLAWGKNDTSITLSRDAPTLGRWSYGDAWDTGFNWGLDTKESVNQWGSQFQNGSGVGSGVAGGAIAFGSGGSFDNGLNVGLDDFLDGLLNDVNNIAEDTGNIANSMELTEEDLKYLRSVAEMEWKKEYTTAEINIEMNNNNTVNGDSDLDGIVTKLSEKLYEELNIVANGVYA